VSAAWRQVTLPWSRGVLGVRRVVRGVLGVRRVVRGVLTVRRVVRGVLAVRRVVRGVLVGRGVLAVRRDWGNSWLWGKIRAL
jgi:hypothetical protein